MHYSVIYVYNHFIASVLAILSDRSLHLQRHTTPAACHPYYAIRAIEGRDSIWIRKYRCLYPKNIYDVDMYNY